MGVVGRFWLLFAGASRFLRPPIASNPFPPPRSPRTPAARATTWCWRCPPSGATQRLSRRPTRCTRVRPPGTPCTLWGRVRLGGRRRSAGPKHPPSLARKSKTKPKTKPHPTSPQTRPPRVQEQHGDEQGHEGHARGLLHCRVLGQGRAPRPQRTRPRHVRAALQLRGRARGRPLARAHLCRRRDPHRAVGFVLASCLGFGVAPLPLLLGVAGLGRGRVWGDFLGGAGR